MRLFWLLNGSRRGWIKSHLHYRKKPDPDPLKSGSDQFVLTVYTLVTIRLGLWLKSAIVHMRETTVKHGRLTWRRWYGTKIRLLSAFEQQKEAGLVFFRFWSHCCLWPQNQKKASPDPFHENMVRKVYTAKISGPYQLFCVSWPIFLCSVNGALDFGLQGWIGTLGLEQIFLTLIEVIKLCLTCTGEATKRGTWTHK